MDLESAFTEEMRKIYDRALEDCDYRATRFLQMISEDGGLRAAKRLLALPNVSEGFVKLSMCNCLELTVESLVLKDEWRPLFTEDELKIARRRLRSS